VPLCDQLRARQLSQKLANYSIALAGEIWLDAITARISRHIHRALRRFEP
jgi:hypothetical protein